MRASATQSASIAVTERGYEPAVLTLRPGVPARVTFTRRTEGTCGTEIILAAYNIKQTLPLNRPVVVAFTPQKTGEFVFTCGMNMMKGRVIVR